MLAGRPGAADRPAVGLAAGQPGQPVRRTRPRGAAYAGSERRTSLLQVGQLAAAVGDGDDPGAPLGVRAGRPRPPSAPDRSAQPRTSASTAARSTLSPPVITTSSRRPSTSSRPSRPAAASAVGQPAVDQAGGGQLRAAAGSRENSTAPPIMIWPPSASTTVHAVQRAPVVDAAAAGLAHPVASVTTAMPGRPGLAPAARPRSGRRRPARRRTRPAPPTPGRRGGPGTAGSAPARGSGGRQVGHASPGRSRRSRADRPGPGAGEHGPGQHHQPGDVVAGQGQQPVARAAEPGVGRRGRGPDRGPGQHRRLGPAGGAGGGTTTAASGSHRLVGTEHGRGPARRSTGRRGSGATGGPPSRAARQRRRRVSVGRRSRSRAGRGADHGPRRSRHAESESARDWAGDRLSRRPTRSRCRRVPRADRAPGHGAGAAPPAGPSGARSWTTPGPSWCRWLRAADEAAEQGWPEPVRTRSR